MSVRYADNVRARLLTNVPLGKKLHVYVIDPNNAIYLSRMEASLNTSASSGSQSGLKVNAASGVIEIGWTGEIYIIGDAASVQYDFSVD